VLCRRRPRWRGLGRPACSSARPAWRARRVVSSSRIVRRVFGDGSCRPGRADRKFPASISAEGGRSAGVSSSRFSTRAVLGHHDHQGKPPASRPRTQCAFKGASVFRRQHDRGAARENRPSRRSPGSGTSSGRRPAARQWASSGLALPGRRGPPTWSKPADEQPQAPRRTAAARRRCGGA